MKKIIHILTFWFSILAVPFCVIMFDGCTKKAEVVLNIDKSNSYRDSDNNVRFFQTRYPVHVSTVGTKDASYVVIRAKYIDDWSRCSCGHPECIPDTVANVVDLLLPDEGRWRITAYAHDNINRVDSTYEDVEMRYHQ